MKKVIYVFPTSHHYRKAFHERLRSTLRLHNIDYRVVYSEPSAENILKSDTVDIEWGIVVPTWSFKNIKFQIAFRELRKADLIIIQQESSLILNYFVQLLSFLGLKRVAFFGHGRNFQSRRPRGFAELWKRFWAKRVDWWFAYTEETKRHLEAIGYDKNKVTVFNNSVDISELRAQILDLTSERLGQLRDELCLTGDHVGVFVGGIYPDKRPKFLIEAADIIRKRLPNFELLVIGGGPDLPILKDLAADRPWVRVLGPRFGIAKIELMKLGQVFMMPGLVGLAILDAAASRLPIATTNFPWHSPEIAYLDPDENGLLVDDWQNPAAYGNAVADLLEDPIRLAAMADAAEAMSRRFSVEAMAHNFAEGVVEALKV